MLKKVRRFIAHYLLILLFIISFTLCLWLSNVQLTSPIANIGKLVNAQTPDAAQLVNRGIESYKKGDFRSAIQPWEEALKLYQKSNNSSNAIVVSENLARAYQHLGDTDAAISYWENVIAYSRSQQNLLKVGQVSTEIAQIYSSLGQTSKAISLLCGVYFTKPLSSEKLSLDKLLNCQQGSALYITKKQKNQQSEVAVLGSLGEAYRLKGSYDIAIQYLEAAEKIYNETYKSAILNSLGNAHASRAQLWNVYAKSARQQGVPKADEFQNNAKSHYEQALNYFQLSLKEAQQQNDISGEMRSLLNLIQLSYRSEVINLVDETQVNIYIQQALELLDKLPDSVNKVYAAIDLANLPAAGVGSTAQPTQCLGKQRLQDPQAQELFNKAIKISQILQDSRSESYTLGALGHFYECRQQYQAAQKLTRKAIWIADQKLKARDSLYLWEWQAGRILKAQNRSSESLAFYERAYNILEKLRSDILIADRDFQFDFREIIEPVYRQLAELQLELAISNNKISEKTSKLNLDKALITINSLRLAEIQNYFGNDCILEAFNNKRVDEFLGNDTVVISSIILEDKTGILIALPNKEKHLKWIYKDKQIFQQQITKFRAGILNGQEIFTYDTTQAENLYELIIRPFEKYLNPQQIKTLVFIQDGFLRNVPMAALYDKREQKYLVQKYAIATTPSLQLTSAQKTVFKENRALILAVSQEAKVDDKVFDRLKSVPLEVKNIQQEFPNSKILENQDFVSNKLKKELENTVYPIIHIATHAQFGIIPEDTFLVTGNNDKLTINQLETLLRQAGNGSNSVELLTLTACETAVGDDRATLGLAGIALQAGAKSAMASLWSVKDESTADLVTEFYNKLRRSGLSKTAALQAAQLKLIAAKENTIDDKYNHPYYWAPFIIIGNWL